MRPLLAALPCLSLLGSPAPVEDPAHLLARAEAHPSTPARARGRALLEVAGVEAPAFDAVVLLGGPDRWHVALLDPAGGPAATFASDGSAVAVDLLRADRHLVAADAGAVLQAHGLGLGVLAAALGGRVELGGGSVSAGRLADGSVAVLLRTEAGSLRVDVEPTGAHPTRLEASGSGGFALAYGPFEAGRPTSWELDLPLYGVRLQVADLVWEEDPGLPDAAFAMAARETHSSVEAVGSRAWRAAVHALASGGCDGGAGGGC